MEAGLLGTHREVPNVLEHVGRGFRSSLGILEAMRQDSLRAHNCRVHEPDVSDDNHVGSDHDEPTRHAINPDDEAVELPLLGRDACFVAGEDAFLLEIRRGARR